jgi:hypothetical protein
MPPAEAVEAAVEAAVTETEAVQPAADAEAPEMVEETPPADDLPR